MSTRSPAGAAPSGNPLGWPDMADAADPPAAGRREYVLWPHIGEGSVFFYPPGSVEEHLVTEHGLPSVDLQWRAGSRHNHAGDHARQASVAADAVGHLAAVAHAHPDATTPGRRAA
jgi:hypothetical protein